MKCLRFSETREYEAGPHGATKIMSPTSHFNNYTGWEGKSIYGIQALADSEGVCKTILVWYEEEQTNDSKVD